MRKEEALKASERNEASFWRDSFDIDQKPGCVLFLLLVACLVKKNPFRIMNSSTVFKTFLGVSTCVHSIGVNHL